MTMAVWVKLAERMMPSFFRAPAELKPLPASAEDFKEELRLFENLDRDADPPPRAKLYHCLLLSVNIKRPFNSTMILVVGSTGVGKSSTINHLLDTGEGIPVALTSCSESETKATSEYILTTDDSNYEVCDLKMGIIDTPGLNDTAGVKQDACNFVSIKRFFETHPGLPEQSIYPNLVFLVVNVNDTRVKGKNSSLSKCLRGIKLLEVVDTRHPNLVVVVTHCCSVSYKNLRKWKDKMKEKKDTILAIVFEALGVSAPVVLIENDFDGHDLKKEGDFTILPNGDRQPKNLYDACAELLHRNKDNFGLLVFNSCFTRAKKDRPTEGHKVEAEDSKSKELSDEEEKFLNAFSDDARRVEAKDSKSEELSDEEEEFSNAFSDDAKRDLQPFYDQKEKCQLKYQKYIPVQPRKQPITREGSITEPYIIIGFAILNELVKKFWKVITGYFYAQDKLLKKDRLDENYYSKALTRLEWLKSVKFVDGNEECSERHLEIVCKLGRVPRTKDIYDIFGKDSLPLITYKEDSQEEWFKTHVLDENSDMKTGFKCKLTRLEWLESFKIVETNQGGTNESRLEIVCKLGKVPCTRDIVNIFSKDVLPFISYREGSRRGWFEESIFDKNYTMKMEYKKKLAKFHWVKSFYIGVTREPEKSWQIYITHIHDTAPSMQDLKKLFGVNIASFVDFIKGSEQPLPSPRFLRGLRLGDKICSRQGDYGDGTVSVLSRATVKGEPDETHNAVTCYHSCFKGEVPKQQLQSMSEMHNVFKNDFEEGKSERCQGTIRVHCTDDDLEIKEGQFHYGIYDDDNDIALIKLHPTENCTAAIHFHDEKNIRKKLASSEEIARKFYDADKPLLVRKIGAITGAEEGEFYSVDNVLPFQGSMIQFPYSVRGIHGGPFGVPGDSGALVYLVDENIPFGYLCCEIPPPENSTVFPSPENSTEIQSENSLEVLCEKPVKKQLVPHFGCRNLDRSIQELIEREIFSNIQPCFNQHQ